VRYLFADDSDVEEDQRVREQAINKLVDLLVKEKRGEDLAGLLTELRPFFSAVPKAKTAKLVRHIIEQLAKIPNSTALQTKVVTDSIEWCKAEKRSFLRMRLELRLASL
jgi:26S proteasome regulatory subunit N6